MFGILFALIVVAIAINAFSGALGWVEEAEARRKAANEAACDAWKSNLVRGTDGTYRLDPAGPSRERRPASVSGIIFYASLVGCAGLLYGMSSDAINLDLGTGLFTLLFVGLPTLAISGTIHLIVRLGRQ